MGGLFLTIKKMAKATTITKEQIENWKEQYGEIYALPVDDKKRDLRAPNMTDYKRAFTAMQKQGEVAFGETMLTALWLGGDEEIKTDDAYFLSARKELMDFFNYEDPEINKLSGGKTEIKIGENKCVVRVITRADLKLAEKKNPGSKPFVTQERLFEMVCLEMDDAFKDQKNAALRFPLFQAIEKLQNQKVAILEKL